jgi:hypothetical protein
MEITVDEQDAQLPFPLSLYIVLWANSPLTTLDNLSGARKRGGCYNNQ